jgi:predicted nucleotidyltransferase
MKYSAEEICEKLHLNYNDILNIYPYGSKVYGSANEFSDNDYVIVYKQSLLPSGAFKDDAITSDDGDIQGVCYSKGGFINDINNYHMTALESIFLPDDMIVKKTIDFKMSKYNQEEMIRKIVSQSSAQWHLAILAFKDCNYEYVSKSVYHALRKLIFAIQIKECGKIVDYTSTNDLKYIIYNEETCSPHEWNLEFTKLSNSLKM